METFKNPLSGRIIFANSATAKKLFKNDIDEITRQMIPNSNKIPFSVLKDTNYIWNKETQMLVKKNKIFDMRYKEPILKSKHSHEYVIDTEHYTIRKSFKKNPTFPKVGMEQFSNDNINGIPFENNYSHEVISKITDTIFSFNDRKYKNEYLIQVFVNAPNANTEDHKISHNFNIDRKSKISLLNFKKDFKDWVEKTHIKDSMTIAYFDKFLTSVMTIPKGGCSNSKKETIYAKLNDITIYNLPSKGNNCFFISIMDKLKEVFPNTQSNVIIELLRKKYHLGYNELVSIDIAQKIYSTEVGKEIVIINSIGESITSSAKTRKSVGSVVMFNDNHFYKCECNIKKIYKTCDKCGKQYLNKHDKDRCIENADFKNKNKIHTLKEKISMAFVEKERIKLEDELYELENNIRFVKTKSSKIRPLNNHEVLHYDIETHYKNKNRVHTPYIVGYAYYDINNEIQYGTFEGDNCMLDFVSFILNSDKLNHIKFINAYNGASFDHPYFLKAYNQLGNKLETTLSNGSFIGSKIKKQITLTEEERQSIIKNKYKNALKRAQKNFQITQEKKDEIYNNITQREGYNKDIIITLWDLYKHCSTKLETALKDWGCEISKGSINHSLSTRWEETSEERKNDCLMYLKADVLGLMELYNKQNQYYNEKYGIVLTDYITTSQATYDYWRTKLNDKKIYIPTYEEDSFMRQSAYGGRTYPNKKLFKSTQYNIIKNGKLKYDDINDCIRDLDVVSLYPTAMMCDYPIGEPIKTDIYQNDKMGIYYAKMVTNKKLLTPAVPRRTENGELVWDLNDCEGVWNSIDIENGKQYGYQFEIINGIYWDEKAPIFAETMNELFQAKANSKKGTAQYNVSKLWLNALYGKNLQRPIIETTEHISSQGELLAFTAKHIITDVIQFDDKSIIIQGSCRSTEEQNKRVNKPSQNGSFILAYSRRIMLEWMKKTNPSDEMEKLFYYTDTDSLLVHNSCMDNIQTGKQLGDLSYDVNGKIIKAEFIAPKLYHLEYITPDNKIEHIFKGKGCNTKHLDEKKFMKMLNGKEVETTFDFQIKKAGFKLNSKQKENGISQLDRYHINKKNLLTKGLNKTIWNGRNFSLSKQFSLPFGYVA